MNKPASRFQFSLRTLLLVFVVLASSLATFGPCGITLFVLLLGLAIFLNQAESLWSVTEFALGVGFCGLCLLGVLLSRMEISHGPFCSGNLKQIALGLQNYHQANGCFPPAYIADKNGKPMHSWRVLILPYIECDSLYKSYNFNEPWDGPNNRKLLTERPGVYVCPSDLSHNDGVETNYVAIVGPNAAWPGAKPRDVRSLTLAGSTTSQTIMIVETTGSGIAWSEPRDLSLDLLGAARAVTVSSEHRPDASFFYAYDHRCGANVAMADGSVRYLSPGSLATENQRKMLELGAARDEELDAIDALDAPRDEPVGLNWPNIAALAVWVLSVGAILTRAVRSRKARSGSPPESTPLPPPGSPSE